jgi:sporulation protein YabP
MEGFGNEGTRMHKVMLGNRRTCTISGVNDVLSFDIREILLETEQGMLMIKGEDLHVNRLTLDKGEVDVDGKIDSLTYSDIGSNKVGAKGESFLTKLFR